MKKWMSGVLVSLVIGTLLVWSLTDKGTNGEYAAASFDLAEGAILYQDHCIACHGAELRGQSGWQSAGSDNGSAPHP